MPQLLLDSVHPETDLIRVMHFISADGSALPEYTAGAHLQFELDDLGARAYSLIDWPETTGGYTIAVQREADGQGGSKAMHAMQVRAIVTATEPKNDFALTDDTQAPVLLLAGGIGITPLISMATELGACARPFALHYTARTGSRMGFADKLKTAFSDALTLYFDNKAPLDLQALISAQAPATHLYICGPLGLIEAAKAAATLAGFPSDQVHVELFSAPEQHSGDTAFEVEINSGDVINVAADQTIIEALEAAGVDVMYDCARGDCGICQTDVLSGTPDHRDVVLSDEERAAGNVMQICVSRAKSARLKLDL